MSWEQLGEQVRSRRTELGLTQEELAERGGPSTPTLRAIENNRAGRLSPRLRRTLERALRWQAGSVDAILTGGAATVEAQPSSVVAPELYALIDRLLSLIRMKIMGPSSITSGASVLDGAEEVRRLTLEVEDAFVELGSKLDDAKYRQLQALIRTLHEL